MEKGFTKQMAQDLAMIADCLKQVFAGHVRYAGLQEAMEYSLMAGGKRIRPVLTLETCRLCGGAPEAALPFACAVEMVHTYSLIHDDLPAMDNDDLRRGLPTNHVVYGEATAILAGDALLTAAFEQLTRTDLPAERIVEAVRCLSQAAGSAGMAGGQALDMAGEGRALGREELELLQSLKTGRSYPPLRSWAASPPEELPDSGPRCAPTPRLWARHFRFGTICWMSPAQRRS